MIKDEITIIDKYYIIDYNIDINELEYAISDYWNIECGLHGILDVIMKEDYSKSRKENSI